MNYLKTLMMLLVADHCLSVIINKIDGNPTLLKAKDSLKKIGSACKAMLKPTYDDLGLTQGEQFASIFSIPTTSETNNPIDLTCLNKLPDYLHTLPEARMKEICEFTTRVIYKRKSDNFRGTLEWDLSFVKKHTEATLFDYIKKEQGRYTKNLFRLCYQMKKPDTPDANIDGIYIRQKITKFNLLLYSFNSPCDTCFKEINAGVTGGNTFLDRIGVQKIMVFYDELFRYTSADLIRSNRNNKVQYWLTDAQDRELKSRKF